MFSDKQLDAETTFVIIGAGSAGITSARTLLENGYRNVVIVEANDEAGGKCRSVFVDGRAYDMGAVIGTRGEDHDLLELVRRHGLSVIDTDSSDLPAGKRPPRFGRPGRTAFEFLKYSKLITANWQGVEAGELRSLSSDLCETFAAVSERRGLAHIEKRFRPLYMGMGYGAPAEIPMAYLTSFLNLRALLSVMTLGCFSIREGIQEVWVREAKALEQCGVRFLYGTRVVRITRDRCVEIHTDSASQAIACRKLIVACDPRGLGLDATDSEQELMQWTRNEDYHVLLCRIEGFPSVRRPTFYFVEDNLNERGSGRPVVLYRKFPDSDVYAAYVYSGGRSQAELALQLAEDVEMLGGRLKEHLGYLPWDYFPHFSSDSLKRGAIDSLGRLQGERHTIYVGEWTVLGRLSRTIANARLMTRRLIGHSSA